MTRVTINNRKSVSGFDWDKTLNSAMNQIQYNPAAKQNLHPYLFTAAVMFLETEEKLIDAEQAHTERPADSY